MKKIHSTYNKILVVLLASWISTTTAKAQSALAAPIVIAQMAEFKNLVNYVLGFLMLIIFVMGVIRVANGIKSIYDGDKDQGMNHIWTGAGMAVAPFLVWGAFTLLGFGGAGVGPTEIRFEE